MFDRSGDYLIGWSIDIPLSVYKCDCGRFTITAVIYDRSGRGPIPSPRPVDSMMPTMNIILQVKQPPAT